MVERKQQKEAGERVYRLLTQYWQVGVALMVTSAFFLVSLDKVRKELETNVVDGILVISLLIATTLWLLAYMHGTLDELEMLHDHSVGSTVKSISWYVLAVIVIIAVSFGALIAFVTEIIIYSCIAILVMLANCTGFAIVQRSVFLAGVEQGGKENNRVPAAIVQYYLYRPFLLHQVGVLLGFFLALTLGIMASYEQNPSLRRASEVTAIITICAGECVISRWRKSRDQQLP